MDVKKITKELFEMIMLTNERMQIIERQLDTLMEASKILHERIEVLEND